MFAQFLTHVFAFRFSFSGKHKEVDQKSNEGDGNNNKEDHIWGFEKVAPRIRPVAPRSACFSFLFPMVFDAVAGAVVLEGAHKAFAFDGAVFATFADE